MTSGSTFRCSCCAQPHDGPPLGYAAPAPAYWHADLAHQPDNMLEGERCVIAGTHFFVRARLVLPIVETGGEFEWGVWVSVSEQSFGRMSQLWDRPERVEEPPYFGWLATELAPYEPTTLNLKTNLHTQPVGIRPLVELEPTDHPLAIEQRHGITLPRIQSIAERLLQPPIR
ncbi:DUF2199 domain-containing protein [Nocardia sp. CDC160]|uniref:DUF2199 domain-containing protein n=1 Tax=Nocardia sp. CDC160 TaxID=3112166 RepID=UPI002DB869DE|nr:DUF2199 domain-containing protein [Nocardia sp. CDC160]MEC3918875.1 DUF2199 domain-containing protein [Nocardia sp. CDC160]